MARHFDLEEQEQIAQFKHFWGTWGNLITWSVIVIMGALAAWNGYRYWQARQAQQSVAMLDAVQVAAQAKDLERVQQIFGDLTKDYPRTVQAGGAGLLAGQEIAKARRREGTEAGVGRGDHNPRDEGFTSPARLRLAGVLIQEKSYDDALAQLSASFPPEFAAVVADRKGDALDLQGKKQDAIAEYRRAYDGLNEQLAYRQVVQAKLDALGAGVPVKEGA